MQALLGGYIFPPDPIVNWHPNRVEYEGVVGSSSTGGGYW